MRRNLTIVIVISILIALIVWWYGEDLFLDEQKQKVIDEEKKYSFGSLNPNLTGQTIAQGCTDESAFNYNKLATEDDGSCIFKFGCCDIEATNYDAEADSCDVPGNNNLCDYGTGVGNIPNEITPHQFQGCVQGHNKYTGGNCDVWCQLIMMSLLKWEDLKSPNCMIQHYTNGYGNCPAICENGTPADNPNYIPPNLAVGQQSLSSYITQQEGGGYCNSISCT